MKLGDLWVKLGLRSDEYSKGLKGAEKETQSFGQRMGGIWSAVKVAGAAAFAAIAVKAVSAFAKIALDTDKFGDRFKRMTSGLKSAWNTFTNSLMNWDWDGFWDRVRGANKAGRELFDVEDAMYEQSQALRLRRAELERENEHLRILANDSSKSYKERKKAAEDYLDSLKPIYAEEEAMARQHRDAVEKNLLATRGIAYTPENAGKLETFLRNGAMIPLGKELDDTYYQISQGFATMSQDAKQKLYDVIAAAGEAAGAFERENRRMFSALNTASAGLLNGGSTAPKVDLAAVQGYDNTLMEEDIEDMASDAVQAQIDAYAKQKAARDQWVKDIHDGYQDAAREMQDGNQHIYNELDDLTERAVELAEEFKDAVVGGFSAGMQELTDQLFGLKDVNAGAILAALLTPLADMAIREGEIAMATGLGIEAIKDSLHHLTGAPALVAGAALIAIGAAAKSGLQALAQGNTAAATTSTYTGGSTGAGVSTIQTELTIHLDGKLRGGDILLSGQRTLDNWAR